ncbi:MAG: universal stress protein [Candidatus Bathyarchaeota archaeon]|nr:universal stress protein [Candidatus Bathyarchaeum tardum]WGM89415.1 MAG: universal stress protein [Candidatus Bathyarchaeum tardum]WNZ28305.1 MAG: universal stress protein [Candidatus Bathyarchaeota archaeon]
MIEKILAPIDGSAHSDNALVYALDLAEKYSAEITILTVIEPVILPGPVFVNEPSIMPPSQFDYQKNIQNLHEKMLEETFKKISKAHPELKIKKQHRIGRPADEIIEIANKEKFDLIVIGSRGRGKIKEFFLGSVSDRVADSAKCPVLIVK